MTFVVLVDLADALVVLLLLTFVLGVVFHVHSFLVYLVGFAVDHHSPKLMMVS